MPWYRYIARDREGRKVKGNIESESSAEAAGKVRDSGLVPLVIKKKNGTSALGKLFRQNAVLFPPKPRDLVVFSRELATLIDAGIPIVQALDTIVTQTHNRSLKKIVSLIRKDIEAGVSPSTAFSRYPRIFPSLFSRMLQAGEMTGEIDEMLSRMAEHMESLDEITQKIKSSLRYPLFIILIGSVLGGFMLFYVLPRIESLYHESLGSELPAFTRFVLDFSRGVRANLPWVILGIVFIWLVFKILGRGGKGRYVIERIKLKIPVFGKIHHRLVLVRVTRTLATLLEGGISILDSLDMSGKIAGNIIVEKSLEDARRSLEKGSTIADALRFYSVFPPMVIHMISVGEKSGMLEKMLNRIAQFYQQEVENTVNSLASLLEPLLLLFIGITIGTLVVAMYLPYFTMFVNISVSPFTGFSLSRELLLEV